jgi:hypothetical protein
VLVGRVDAWEHGIMRELVYLSQHKLQTFIAGRPKRWWKRLSLGAKVNVPGIGEVSASRSGDSSPDVDQIIAALDRTERAAKWFDDDAVAPGSWVHFEAPMNYKVLERRPYKSMVVFYDQHYGELFGDLTGSRQRRDYAAKALLLHGSASHLVGGPGQSDVELDLNHYPSGSDLESFLTIPRSPLFKIRLARAMRSLRSVHDNPAATEPGTDHRMPQQINNPKHLRLWADMLAWSWRDDHYRPGAWMAGFARVTAVFDFMVVATPLYVEYVGEPDETMLGRYKPDYRKSEIADQGF